ncbi:unnamed protein product [Cladocopium goreaui]|uniref:PAS domain-containing protein n=1 Tax=Cladocopium goreaui TaxID=2562237 RepID=A0A9P1DRK9_9DINO|nr:unnamed protein product [Cladocopium goreaui]
MMAEEAKKAKEAKEAKEGEEGEEAAAEATEEPAAEETEAKDAEMKEEEPKAEEPKAEEEDLGDEPPQVELTEEEEKQNFIKGSIPDVSPAVLAKAFASFTVPEKSEGFDEVNYEWQGAAESKEYLRKWVLETKLTTRIEDLQPSNDFKEKYSAWQKALTELQTKQKAWKSGGKKDGSKEGGAVDIFSVEDINDIGGGEPLYSNFEAEDWAMLQLRYEFFLLQDAFIKDVNDEDRTAIPEAHLAFYYQKYFKKAINTKQFSLSDVPELLNLIKDTVAIDEETKMFTKVLEDAESLDILVKCTEESRKERKRRIDAGDETARLKFLSHNPAPAPVPAAVPPAPAAVGLQKGKGKAMGKGKPMKGMMGKCHWNCEGAVELGVRMLRLAVKRDSRIAQRDARTKRSVSEAAISTEKAYLICDSRSKGFPIRHVSKGFEAFFGCNAAECVGSSCSHIVSGRGFEHSAAAALNKVAGAGIDVETSIDRMSSAAEKAVQSAAKGGSMPVILISVVKHTGDLCVCELSMCKQNHPTLGWSYHAALLKDVSGAVSVTKLFKSAQTEQSYEELCSEWRQASRGALGDPAPLSGDLSDELNAVAEQLWKDELAKGIKPKASAVETKEGML